MINKDSTSRSLDKSFMAKSKQKKLLVNICIFCWLIRNLCMHIRKYIISVTSKYLFKNIDPNIDSDKNLMIFFLIVHGLNSYTIAISDFCFLLLNFELISSLMMISIKFWNKDKMTTRVKQGEYLWKLAFKIFWK